jgi:hypothetical protein
MENVAFVTYADGRYIPVQQTLIRSIRKLYPHVTIFAFNSIQEIGPHCPSHSVSPYAFKVYAIEYARNKGYDIVIWLDSPNRLVRPIDNWLQEISNVGVYLQADGWKTGQWANDKSLQYFGITRDEAMQIQNIYACIMAFDFRHPKTFTFFRKWKSACLEGVFRGRHKNDARTESNDERCMGHRHDQTCAEIIAYQIGIPLSTLVLGENGYFLSWIDI